jgi:hypothetical protein
MALLGPTHMWHPRIHERWADEELIFWRLAFFPAYRRDHIVSAIRSIMEEQEVSSYVVYETLGAFDLFLSTWLPTESVDEFEAGLNRALEGEALQLLEPFAVTRLLHHWLWDDGEGGLREPSAEVLAQRWDAGMIARANRDGLSSSEKTMSEEMNVIASVSETAEGIPFIIAVSSAPYSLAVGARGHLARHLLDLLDKYDIAGGALYEGSGFGIYVLTGTVRTENFHLIPELSSAVNTLAEHQTLTARPFTHICVEIVDYADSLRADAGDERTDIADLLNSSPSHDLEFEPSAALDWRTWLSDKDVKPSADEAVVDDGLIKTVVGMLNADGGRVVVGALAGDLPLPDGLLRESQKLERFPRVGNFVCIGVNQEYGEDGWEGFQLQLRDWLASKIDPAPIGACGIRRYAVDGVDMCIVDVEPRRSTWYYRNLGPAEPVRFYVRDEARTVALAGSTADTYKQSRPRSLI